MGWRKSCILGKGSYGTVYLAASDDSSLSVSTVAVKSSTSPKSIWLEEEGTILFQMRGCKEIVQCFGEDRSIENGREVYNLLLEYAAGGTLHSLIKNHQGPLPESMVAYYSYMLLNGLCHVHTQGFVHCDMKPANVLVFPSKDGSSLHNLKISDFGLALKFDHEESKSTDGKSVDGHRGTLVYSSPESIFKGLHKPATDIWSFGCIVLEMITRKRIWSTARTTQELYWKIAFGDPIPEHVSNDAKDFLNKCFAKDHRQRWTADLLLDHPFIVKNLKSLPSDFENPINPFITGGAWASTLDLFKTPPKHQEPTDLAFCMKPLLPHQLCPPPGFAPRLPHQLCPPPGFAPLLPHQLCPPPGFAPLLPHQLFTQKAI